MKLYILLNCGNSTRHFLFLFNQEPNFKKLPVILNIEYIAASQSQPTFLEFLEEFNTGGHIQLELNWQLNKRHDLYI